MEAKHTPGPWIADGSESTTATWVNGSDGKRICTVKPSFSDWSNARLIAAAPELLEALKAIAELNTIYPPNYNTMTEAQKGEWTHYGKFAVIARAAIAKATGE